MDYGELPQMRPRRRLSSNRSPNSRNFPTIGCKSKRDTYFFHVAVSLKDLYELQSTVIHQLAYLEPEKVNHLDTVFYPCHPIAADNPPIPQTLT